MQLNTENIGTEPHVLKTKGNEAFKDADFKSAIQFYSKAIIISSNNAEKSILLSNRAAAHLKLNQYAEALNDCNESLRLASSGGVKVLFRKAVALEGLGEIANALAACRSGLLLEPSNASLFELAARLTPLCASTLVQKPSFNKSMLPKLFTGAPFQHIPSVDGIDENLLLLFHGLGDNPGPFVALAKTLALPQTSCIALGAPHEVPLSDGGRSWFTVLDPTTFELIPARRGEERRIRSMESTVDALEQLLLNLHVYCGYAPRKIHLFGFSQGGTVAMQLARRCATKGKMVGSCVAIASGLLEEQLYDVGLIDERNSSSNNIDKKIPVLLLHGDKDAVVSRTRVSGTEELMKNEGMEVEMHSIPGKGHTMLNSEAETRIVMKFWAQNLSNRPPPPPDDENKNESGSGGGEQPSTLIELAPGVASISLA